MPIELIPLPLPASADASKFTQFGRQGIDRFVRPLVIAGTIHVLILHRAVKGVEPGNFTSDEFEQIKEALYKVRWS